MWKGEHCSRDVAVKVIRTYANSNLQKILGVSQYLCYLFHVHALTTAYKELLQGGCDVEGPPASECPAVDRSDDVRKSVHNGIRLDGKWEHQRFFEGTPKYKPVGTGMILYRLRFKFAD